MIPSRKIILNNESNFIMFVPHVLLIFRKIGVKLDMIFSFDLVRKERIILFLYSRGSNFQKSLSK